MVLALVDYMRCFSIAIRHPNTISYGVLILKSRLKARALNPKGDCKKIEVSACKLFKGTTRTCLKNIQYNCCFDKGIIKEMIGCSDEEKDLQDKNEAKLCVFTGSWRTRVDKVWSRAQSYCCFNSRLARIIQTEGRRQLGVGWGDRKNPDCRPLTLAEMKRIDFSKVDFSELYDELKQKAIQDFAKAKEDMTSTKFQAIDFSGGINNKLKKFYEK